MEALIIFVAVLAVAAAYKVGHMHGWVARERESK